CVHRRRGMDQALATCAAPACVLEVAEADSGADSSSSESDEVPISEGRVVRSECALRDRVLDAVGERGFESELRAVGEALVARVEARALQREVDRDWIE